MDGRALFYACLYTAQSPKTPPLLRKISWKSLTCVNRKGAFCRKENAQKKTTKNSVDNLRVLW